MKFLLWLFLSNIHSIASEEAIRSRANVHASKDAEFSDADEDFFWRELGRNSYPPSK